jgi:glucose uptake protein GlcU
MIKTVINTLLYILGIIAVVMIIIGGLRYVTSSGDASHVKAAKDTILYSIVGLVVAILAYTIVNYVLTTFQ